MSIQVVKKYHMKLSCDKCDKIVGCGIAMSLTDSQRDELLRTIVLCNQEDCKINKPANNTPEAGGE